MIPEAVVAEIRAGPQRDTAQRWLTADGHAYIRQAQPVDTIIAGWDLGAGESAVLTWARQHPETEAVLDDRAARNCAKVQAFFRAEARRLASCGWRPRTDS